MSNDSLDEADNDIRTQWHCNNCDKTTTHKAKMGDTEHWPGVKDGLRRTHVCEICGTELPTIEIRATRFIEMLGPPQEWGIDNTYLVALGKITIAFQYLEGHLGYVVFMLLGGDRKIEQCITSEMNFRQLIQLINSLYKLRVEQFGERQPLVTEILKDALAKSNAANEERNKITHSQWGFDSDFQIVIEKITAKNGLRANRRKKDSPADILVIAEQIIAASEALMDFCRRYIAVYHGAYPIGG